MADLSLPLGEERLEIGLLLLERSFLLAPSESDLPSLDGFTGDVSLLLAALSTEGLLSMDLLGLLISATALSLSSPLLDLVSSGSGITSGSLQSNTACWTSQCLFSCSDVPSPEMVSSLLAAAKLLKDCRGPDSTEASFELESSQIPGIILLRGKLEVLVASEVGADSSLESEWVSGTASVLSSTSERKGIETSFERTSLTDSWLCGSGERSF